MIDAPAAASPPSILCRAVGEVPEGLGALPPLLRRVYAARGVRGAEELDRSLKRLLPPQGLGDVDRAAARLAAAIREREPILLVGDFDADGATSVALGVTLLRALGAEQVDFLVPNR